MGYLVVFLASAVPWLEVLVVVPAGVLVGLAPVPTAIVGAAGNIATLVPIVLGGDRLRSWWRRRRHGPVVPADDEPSKGRRGTRALRVFERYGLLGLALVGPVLIGIHVAAVVAVAARAEPRRALLWLSGGVVVWAFVVAGAAAFGVDTFFDADALPDLFGQVEGAAR